jgi:hypothetical protein
LCDLQSSGGSDGAGAPDASSAATASPATWAWQWWWAPAAVAASAVVASVVLTTLRRRSINAAFATGVAPFGTVLGHNSGVPAFSSHYDSYVHADFATRYLKHHAPWLWGIFMRLGGWKLWQKHYLHNGDHEGREHFYGAKWQCVEYARRWLIHAQGYTFPSVSMAYTIFDMPHAIRVADGAKVAFKAVPNGALGFG